MTPLKIERVCLAGIFFIHGATFASWAGRIPQIQQNLHLTNAELGMSLLALAIGALLSMPATGILGSRLGSAAMTHYASLAFCLSLPFLGAAPSQAWLTAALFVFGFMQGGMDVSMNAQAVVVERAHKRPIMSTFHALFSLGAMAGGAISCVAVAFSMPPLMHFLLFSLLAVPLIVLLCSKLVEPDSPASKHEPLFVLPDRRLAALGAICFCSFIGEGAIADWSGIYLHHALQAPMAVAALGFTVFSLSMAAFRFAGDAIMHRLGGARVLFFGGIVSAMAIGGTLAEPPFPVALLLYVLAGAGFACMVPAVFSAAGRRAESSASLAIAGVATAGYFGFVIAPPIIGALSDWISLRWALSLVVALCILVAVLSGSAREPQAAPESG